MCGADAELGRRGRSVAWGIPTAHPSKHTPDGCSPDGSWFSRAARSEERGEDSLQWGREGEVDVACTGPGKCTAMQPAELTGMDSKSPAPAGS